MKKLRMKRGAAAGALALIAAVSLAGCSTPHVDGAMVALHYDGNRDEGGKFLDCVEAGAEKDTQDTYYPYPDTQREDVWDTDNFIPDSNGDGLPEGSADQEDLEVIDKDGEIAYLQIKVSFTLNTDCEVLRVFHEKIGKTRKAYFNDDGTYNSGWIWAMNNYISSAVEQEAKAAAVRYSVEDMWMKPSVRAEIASAISENIQKAVNDGMEGDQEFYTIGSIRVFGADPDPEFQQLYKDRKAASVKADTAGDIKDAQIKEAKARRAVAEEEAKTRRAEIAGYGSVDAYLKAMMIEQGMNPYQPTYGPMGTSPSAGAPPASEE